MNILLIFLITLCCVSADKWAVLVAGSYGYWNYRHQADICHAYQILHENGFPDSNIIVMMYDDIAYNSGNPFHGVIINKPNGNNMYVNVPKDYTGDDVTPENFLSILRGNSSIGKKVLKTGPDDNIFIFFADHGGPGIICFPRDELYAHELIETLQYMHMNNRYKNIIFYLESCDSGSMFNHLLPPNINVFAMTASYPDEVSWACYYDALFDTYLGDVFSVNWMENVDSFESIIKETFNDQYLIVENKTTSNHVCIYGDKSILKYNLSDFLTYQSNTWADENMITNHPRNTYYFEKQTDQIDQIDQIDSRYVKLKYLAKFSQNYTKIKNGTFIYNELKKEIYHAYVLSVYYNNEIISAYQKKILRNLKNQKCNSDEIIDTKCLQKEVNRFKHLYGDLTEIAIYFLRIIGNKCINADLI